MLLFRQNVNNNPPSQDYQTLQNKIEEKQEPNEHFPTISNDKNSIYTTIPTLTNKNIRYGTEFNDFSIKDTNSNNNVKTLSNDNMTPPKIITNFNKIKTNENQFYAKVILKNTPSPKHIVSLLQDYLTENNYKIYYETSYDSDKIIFSFHEEKIAFEFTKLIYKEKNKNLAYRDIIVHLSLSPNDTYIKKKLENKKRGLPTESILKLFNGNSYVKKIKPPPKIYGNIHFGLKSPFYNVNEKKMKLNKEKNAKSFSDKNLFNKNNSISCNGDLYGYVGYDGKPLKNYEKLRINVLDTHYNPISSFEFREDDKNRWVSPTNFKVY